MIGWHPQLNGHEFMETPEDSEGFPGISVGKESASKLILVKVGRSQD